MVQRKVPEICGSEGRNLKPSSFQLQDSRNRGSEMKKKMKKTKSIKLSDVESLKSSPLKKPVSSQPGKPPPPQDVMKTPQKQSVVRVTGGSPNYMKDTSSSEARRESLSLQVSCQKPKPSSDSKITIRRNQTGSKIGSTNSGNKQTRNLSKTSGLKIVKTLTKIQSFKKCSRVAVYAEMNTQRATCSSTLKNSKFPEYLMLNNGGTEAEGTSILKVCPYTYCSLNGHLHKQYPPLKSFISARRRALKTQRSLKLEACSPSKAKPSDPEGIMGEFDFVKSLMSPKTIEKSDDEIYVEDKGDYDEINGGIIERGNRDFSSEAENRQVAMSLSDGAPRSEIDSEENFGIFSIDIDQSENFSKEEQKVGDKETDFDDECQTSNREADMVPGYGYSDMEREEAVSFSTEANDESVENVSNGSEEDLTDNDVSEYIIADENSCENLRSDNSGFEMDEMIENPEVPEPSEQSESSTGNQVSSNGIATAFLALEETVIESTETYEEFQTNEAPEPVNCGSETDSQLRSLEDKLGSEKISDADKIINGSLAEETQDHDSQNSQNSISSDEISKKEEEIRPEPATEDILPAADTQTKPASKSKFSRARKSSNQEEKEPCKKLMMIKCKRLSDEESEDSRGFNPREPNYLAVIPEPDAEKVDLRHQEMEERKNSEEWMSDYALQQAVTKLAPARKRKVALLVEAFETAITIPKWQTNVTQTSPVFVHGRTLQACN